LHSGYRPTICASAPADFSGRRRAALSPSLVILSGLF
jgi:hypothetical protein